MKVYFRLSIIVILLVIFNACLGSKAPITCSQLSNEYSVDTHIKEDITLNVTKGYQELAKYIFVYDKTSKFNENIDTYFLYLELFKKKSIGTPFINNYCNSINFAIKDENISRVSNELNKIKVKWTNSYNINIENSLKKKIKFNEIDACEEYASKLVEYIITYQITVQKDEIYSVLNKTYRDCLTLANKAKK